MDAQILEHLCKIVQSLITTTTTTRRQRSVDDDDFENVVASITNKMSTTKLIAALRAAYAAKKYLREPSSSHREAVVIANRLSSYRASNKPLEPVVRQHVDMRRVVREIENMKQDVALNVLDAKRSLAKERAALRRDILEYERLYQILRDKRNVSDPASDKNTSLFQRYNCSPID